MTVSTAHRKDLVRTMLIQMVDAVGDDERVGHVFRPDDPRFASILGATWRDMVDAGLIKDFARSDFLLTPSGWITGLRLSGRLESNDVRERAVKIVRALKARVKGRHGIDDEYVDVRELAKELKLPIGWLENAMEAKLLQQVFAKDRMTLAYDGVLIGIPPTFGSDPIEID